MFFGPLNDLSEVTVKRLLPLPDSNTVERITGPDEITPKVALSPTIYRFVPRIVKYLDAFGKLLAYS